MAQFPRRDEHSIEEFVRLKVPGFRLMEDLTDVVDRSLNGAAPCSRSRVPKFLAFLVLVSRRPASCSPLSRLPQCINTVAPLVPEPPILVETPSAISTPRMLAPPLRTKRRDRIFAAA
jgi:hypothetical protein